MDKDFFLNVGIQPSLHFEPTLSSSSSPMPTWQSLSAAMEIHAPELNCSSEQSPDCFLQQQTSWEKSTDQCIKFDSALSSMVSSPVASNSNISTEAFVIRELIGKLGNIGNSGDILRQSHPLLGNTVATTTATASYIGHGNNSTNTSCYSTPLNSPPKLTLPIMDQLVKENLSQLGKSMPLNSSLAEFSGDPGFAERAARFSCFGSRSLNGRTSQLGLNNTELPHRSMGNGKLPRVSSSPSFKAIGSQLGNQENKKSPLQDGTEMEMRRKFSRLSGSSIPDQTEFANSREESSVSEQIPGGEIGLKASNDLNSRKRKAGSRGKAKELASSPSAKATKVVEADHDSNAKRCKQSEGDGNENGAVKAEEEQRESTIAAGDEGQKQTKSSPKPPEPPKDYIHVRARRGQATDSHSLAERVRREKISERMKLLQDLVPGCNKVTGKALMLDEIINYVQSLQRQVEFLSMKLASVNFKMDFNTETHLSKDIFQPNGSLPRPIYPLESSSSALYGRQPQQSQLLQSTISNGAVSHCSVDPLDTALCQNLSMQLPPLDGFGQGVPQLPTFCEDDLQSIVQMGLGKNPNQEMPFQSRSFHGSNQPSSHMKIEL
ncbi:hypothetical protein L1049_004423 [Liquidambar formosana]|uniref:BHLH domain-containing protein n=1 Tax=Liquidambar formosana TaxID=63359 RepID=A0AAP0RP92_LIQFO